MSTMDEGLSTGHSTRPLFTSRKHSRRSTGPQISAVVILVLGIGSAAAGWYWFAGRQTLSPSRDEVPASAGSAASLADAPGPDAPLPSLAESDAVVRSLAGALSAHPELAAWLVTDDLVRRFVKTVVALAQGSSPAPHLAFAAPKEPFSVERSSGRTRIAAASFDRYDQLTETFLSLGAAGAARLYQRLHPLFEQAYGELAISDRSFDEMMSLAVANVLSANVPERPAEVVAREGRYEFSDARLQARTPAEKHLLRAGPENARRIQRKVRELAGAAGIPLP